MAAAKIEPGDATLSRGTEVVSSSTPPQDSTASGVQVPLPTPKLPHPRPSGPSIHQIYALPAPIRTFPLPSFYPGNPLSILYLTCAWLWQVVAPPPKEPSVVHVGYWDPASRSVHIKDAGSMRALWEQGFYGKGSLSRSEPNWLKREEIRRLAASGEAVGNTVSEQRTISRREERRNAKWQRARDEQEALEKARLQEAGLLPAEEVSSCTVPEVTTGMNGHPSEAKAPVGPQELLALPNSLVELLAMAPPTRTNRDAANCTRLGAVKPVHLELPPASSPLSKMTNGDSPTNGLTGPSLAGGDEATKHREDLRAAGNGAQNGSPVHESPDGIAFPPPSPGNGLPKTPSGMEFELLRGKRRKSVRFSPRVESTTFQLSDPPSPSLSNTNSSKTPILAAVDDAVVSEPTANQTDTAQTVPSSDPAHPKMVDIENKEHLQLAPEEAFFLAFGLGALSVVDPSTRESIPTETLLELFRAHSYSCPKSPWSVDQSSPGSSLEPPDPFLVHYAVYHHFRSLGWVPRHGVKFGVDWLVYRRGPVFDHAEFGVIVIPSFSDPRWEAYPHQRPKRQWQWMMGLVRVLSHVFKAFVLVYVDVPPPPVFDAAMASAEGGIAAALKEYKVREVMVRRWSSNRNR